MNHRGNRRTSYQVEQVLQQGDKQPAELGLVSLEYGGEGERGEDDNTYGGVPRPSVQIVSRIVT